MGEEVSGAVNLALLCQVASESSNDCCSKMGHPRRSLTEDLLVPGEQVRWNQKKEKFKIKKIHKPEKKYKALPPDRQYPSRMT